MNGTNNNTGIAKLAKYGPTGVAIALVIAIIIIVNWAFNLFGNHINSNTQVMSELKGSIENLNETVERTSGNQTEALGSLKDAIINLNIRK